MRTARPRVDVASAIPGLASLARTTVRLHPRRDRVPSIERSKIGGMFVWPADEPWPRCPEHDDYLVAVVQLAADEVPGLVMPEKVDLVQLLWCPRDHSEAESLVAHRVFWRNRLAIGEVLANQPQPREGDPEYWPAPCSVSPEQVVEYPSVFELPEEIAHQIEQSEALTDATEDGDALAAYQYWWSTATGTKAGGYVNWIQEAETPVCECGRPMEHLLTVASEEFDGETHLRWCPEEDKNIMEADYDARMRVQSAAGLLFGDAGSIYFFVCRSCPHWRVKSVFQCS